MTLFGQDLTPTKHTRPARRLLRNAEREGRSDQTLATLNTPHTETGSSQRGHEPVNGRAVWERDEYGEDHSGY